MPQLPGFTGRASPARRPRLDPEASSACWPEAPCRRPSSTALHARGSTNIKIDAATASGGNGSSFDNGLVHGNSVIGTSATGTITTTGSVNNNMGITTVFQNSGNNSLFQQSTAINITLQ